MTDDPIPVISKFYECWSDEAAIRKYLDVKDVGHISELATGMAPKTEYFNPTALADAAIALSDAINAGLIRQREDMAANMSYMTMIELLQRLGVRHEIYSNENDIHFDDAVVGPVLRRMRFMVNALKNCGTREDASIADDLTNADARTRLTRPTLPCDLERALRYATNAPKISWQTLQDAFRDFIGIHWINTKMREHLTRQAETLDGRIRRVTGRLAEMGKKKGGDPATLISKQKNEADLKALQAEQSELLEIRDYPTRFKPGTKTPYKVNEASDTIYAASWQNPGSVTNDQAMAWLSTEFHAFWQDHQPAYMKLCDDAERGRKRKKENKRKAGSLGLASREHPLWLNRTKDFLKFLETNPLGSSDLSGSISAFADKHSGLNTVRAKGKVRDFLGALSMHLDRDFDAAAIMPPLRTSGIKALPEEAVRECFDLIKSTLGQAQSNN